MGKILSYLGDWGIAHKLACTLSEEAFKSKSRQTR